MGVVFMFIAAAALALAVHISAMAIYAHGMGVCIRRVSYGVGPTFFTIGKFDVRVIPLSGHVKIKDSRQEALEASELGDAFNHQPLWKQVFLQLAGAMSLAALGVAILGREGWESFLRAFPQIFIGAVSPFDEAQRYLQSFDLFIDQRDVVAVVGMVCVKLGAFNLLPFGALNGGQALITLLKRGRPKSRWEDAASRWGVLATLLLCIGWLLAVGNFALNHAT
jgi:membrane-associated protease RseP (regulator of RpoE activity)